MELPMQRREFLTTAAATAGMALAPLSLRRTRAAGASRVLKFIPQADLAILDPLATTAYVTRNHALMVFDTLFGVDEQYNAQPQMIEGYTVENDGKLWRLTLRDGLRFHDNEPVLSKDVVASISRWGKRDIYAGALMVVLNDLVAASDRVVEFHLSKPFGQLPNLLGKPASNLAVIMPERLALTDPMKQVGEIVGSGPFTFVARERNPGALNVYEKFNGYVPRNGTPSYTSGPKVANFDRVEWHTLPDPSTAAAALQAGEMDWWEQPTSDLAPLLRSNPNIKVLVQDPAGFTGLMRFNHLQPPFDNPAIRRAILSGIQQSDYMLAVVGDNQAMWREGMGFFHPDSPMASKVGLDVFPAKVDLGKVKADLQAAGYRNERVVMLATADFPVIDIMSQIAADMLRKIGVNLDYQAQDWATVSTRMQSKEPIANGGWSVTCNFTAGIGLYNPAAHTWLRSNGPKAFVGWPSIPEIEKLRLDWFDAPDVAAQQTICQNIQKMAFDQVPYVPLGFYYQPTAFRSNLTGILKGVPMFYNVQRV
jgi:peptide/nickel transport system substrate-binding protein